MDLGNQKKFYKKRFYQYKIYVVKLNEPKKEAIEVVELMRNRTKLNQLMIN